jgi:EAL domain-containing protein (putative c-di-GMP-specific phosphodiesterase class I)
MAGSSILSAAVSENEIASRLELAIQRDELSIAFQPKIRAATGALTGVEALARWHDKDLGIVSPSAFIPIAERNGIVDAVTEWLLRAALTQWSEWNAQGFKIPLAFNISALSLRDPYLPDFVQKACERHAVPTEYLTIEVTESATQHVVRLLDTLSRIRLKGMGLALDDFGTGYSSLLQLRQLPYSELKIDRAFVGDALVSSESRLIIQAIVALAKGMGLSTTAEGVEDLGTFAILRELGCNDLQGFLISEALPGPEIPAWILNIEPEWRARCSGQAETVN